jgi:hypothetical protein
VKIALQYTLPKLKLEPDDVSDKFLFHFDFFIPNY